MPGPRVTFPRFRGRLWATGESRGNAGGIGDPVAQKDYLIRELEAFMRALAQVVSLRQDRREATAAVVLDDLSERFLGLGATDAAALTYASLLSRIGEDEETDRDRRLIACDVLYQKALLLEVEGRPAEALRAHSLVFRLLAEAREQWGPAAVEGREDLLGEAAHRIRRADLDLDALLLLWRYHSEQQQYAAAEDVLFRLVEESAEGGGRAGEFVDEGIVAYEALLVLSDAALEGGGLSREEVLEGVEELSRLRPGHLRPPLLPG